MRSPGRQAWGDAKGIIKSMTRRRRRQQRRRCFRAMIAHQLPVRCADRMWGLRFNQHGERDRGKTAKMRHHVRLWQVTPNEWLGAATFDRGVGIALFALQVKHHIGPKVDDERDAVGTVLQQSGAHNLGTHINVSLALVAA